MVIRKEDIEDLDIFDRDELASTETAYKSGVTVVSTTSGTKQVVISGFDLLLERDTPVEFQDRVTLSGTTGGADGTYTLNSVINATTFDVVESIATSTGGTAVFKYPSGASRIGVNISGYGFSSKTEVQALTKDLDYAILLENDPPAPTNDYAITRSGGFVTVETWTRSGGNKIKDIAYTRSGNLITQEDHKVYDTDGTTVLAHLRVVYTRTGGLIVSSVRTRLV